MICRDEFTHLTSITCNTPRRDRLHRSSLSGSRWKWMTKLFTRCARIFVRLHRLMQRIGLKVNRFSFTSRPHWSIDLAGNTLKQIVRNEHHSSLLLTLCDRSTTPNDVRRASMITFKNFIKRNWPSLDNSNVICFQDRNHIKEHIVELMTRSPEHIQEQLSEAITVIGQCDFPEQWPNLPGNADPSIPIATIEQCFSVDQRRVENSAFALRTLSLRAEIRWTLVGNQVGSREIHTSLYGIVSSKTTKWRWCPRGCRACFS